jgi:hypothetical protein
MKNKLHTLIGFVALAALIPSMPLHAQGDYFDETLAISLFAFDDLAIPFTQNLKLEMNRPEKHPDNPVVRRGSDPNDPDSWAVQFYGSVLKVEGKYRMWYCANSVADRKDPNVGGSAAWQVAYAESDDGIHWTKPNLGLVEWRGNTDNNLVKMEPFMGTLNVKVIYDPQDPDPSRRYKMGAHVWWPKHEKRKVGMLAPYVSPDGLTWTYLGEVDPVDAEMPEAQTPLPPVHIEPVGGLFKWDGAYFTSGQNAVATARPYHGRVTRVFMSPDFENWHHPSAIGFVREQQQILLGPGRSREGEQIHEGNSVWVRNNLLIGICGLWHGGVEWDDVTIDLGLVYSHNAVHFYEPINEFTFIKRGDDGEWDQGGLLQGQGFENIGEQTLIYYGAWDPRHGGDPRGGVGLVTLPRDRFGHLSVSHKTKGKGDYQMLEVVSEFMTYPVELDGDGPHRFYVNADGLGDDATLKIELLTHTGKPIPAYAGENAAVVSRSGFQTPVRWDGQEAAIDLPDRIRVKVRFDGEQNTDLRFHAMYVR